MLRQEKGEWILISERRSNRRNFSSTDNACFSGDTRVVTVYVDNLLEDMDAEWLGQIFSKYGRVLDAYIPRKRSKNFMTKFGFVRFNTVAEAKDAIADLNGISIRDKKMLVKLVVYSVVKDQGGVHHRHPVVAKKMDNENKDVNEIKLNGVSLKKTLEKSFVEAVVGSRSGVPKRITINAIGNEWL